MTNEESCYKAFLMAPDMSWESMFMKLFSNECISVFYTKSCMLDI